MYRYTFILILLLSIVSCSNDIDDAAFTIDNTNTTKRERRNVREGNAMYAESEFLKSIENYNKALTRNPNSELVLYNLADAMYAYSRQLQVKHPENSAVSDEVDLSEPDRNAGTANNDDKSSLLTDYASKADSIFRMLSNDAHNPIIREFASYNAGNIAYNDKDYSNSIEYYKVALRLNPDNDKARQNLRLAQLKLQDQQNNQDNNNDNNQDKDQDKDKEKKQDQDKQQQNQDQQNKDQQQNQDQKPPQQQPQDISDQSAEQILKAMENAERDTRQRLEKQPKRINPKYIEKPW